MGKTGMCSVTESQKEKMFLSKLRENDFRFRRIFV